MKRSVRRDGGHILGIELEACRGELLKVDHRRRAFARRVLYDYRYSSGAGIVRRLGVDLAGADEGDGGRLAVYGDTNSIERSWQNAVDDLVSSPGAG